MRAFAPARRVPFVSAKGTKTMFARARSLRACSEAGSPGCLRLRTESRWLRNSLRSNSLRREADSVRKLCRAQRIRRNESLSVWITQELAAGKYLEL